jgi:sugar phosphate isomerase/epimerase
MRHARTPEVAMVALLYETIQFSPFVWEGDPELVRQFGAAADAGFDGIGLDGWSVARHVDGGGTIDELVAALDHHGIRCIELQALTAGDPDTTASDAERMAPLVDAFRPDVVMAGFPTLPTDAEVDAFRRAAERLTVHGARIAIEFLPMLEVRDIPTTVDIVRRTDAPVGVCVDTWHFFRGPDGWAELEALAGADIAHVQFDDALPLVSEDLMYETLQRRTLPGDGVFELDRFCATIVGKGYSGPVGVEIMSSHLRALGPEEFANQVLAAATPYWF